MDVDQQHIRRPTHVAGDDRIDVVNQHGATHEFDCAVDGCVVWEGGGGRDGKM